MFEFFKDIAKRSPSIYRAARSLQMSLGLNLEPEMAILPFVVDRTRLAVDVGANSGAYVHRLLRLGAPVIAIEANPHYLGVLETLYGKKKLDVVWGAASSEEGRALLKIPQTVAKYRYGLATIELANNFTGEGVDLIDVPKITLDGLGLSEVGFIKIDVEGHEQEVLLGAKSLIERDRPVVLVEAENRHRPNAVDSIHRFMSDLGYSGFILDSGILKSLAKFDAKRDQSIADVDVPLQNSGRYRGRYINNFLFLP